MPDIRTLPYGPLEACSHIIRLPEATLLIDPTVEPQRLPHGWPCPQWLIATHGHIDHISQANRLRRAFAAPLAIHLADASCLTDAYMNLSSFIGEEITFYAADILLTDMQVIDLGDGYSLEVIHTPGHSPGSVCLLLIGRSGPLALFTGDTLFASSIGRVDLPNGDAGAMTHSLIRLAQRLNNPQLDSLPIYPGHGPATTWGREKAGNPYLHKLIREPQN